MLTNELKTKITEVAKRLGINPQDLEKVIAVETDFTFSASIKNKAGSGATGLIQFMPKTAIGLGTTTTALAKMTAVDQMEFVYKYLKPHKKKIKSFADCYLAVFYPSYLGKPDSFRFPFGATGYKQNKGLDLDGNGFIELGEFRRWADKKVAKYVPKTESDAKGGLETPTMIAIIIIISLTLIITV